jgi:hypothetical protein
LLRRARLARDAAALDFIAVNETHALAPYRQAALWLRGRGISVLSGVAHPERNAPYVQWLNAVCAGLSTDRIQRVDALSVPQKIGQDWPDWLPSYALWIPLTLTAYPEAGSPCAILLARDDPWSDEEAVLLAEWLSTWVVLRDHFAPLVPRNRVARQIARIGRRWKVLAGAAMIALGGSIEVPLSVMAPGELVAADPMTIRAPIEGVIRQIQVRPNQSVRAGEPLFAFDTLQLASRLDVATQALLTAEAELRQYEQQSLVDARVRAALPAARGNVAEKRAEVDYLTRQLARAQVLAPQDGIAIFDDPQEWIGKPVAVGERILRLAAADQKEIEAWVGVGDAVPLPADAVLRLYLAADPLAPVSGTLRYVAYDAQRRPDGVYAYRIRAALAEPTAHRIGLKGTARLTGESVTLAYWILRRPLATIREFVGL